MVVNGHILIRNLMHTDNLSIYQHKICLPLPESYWIRQVSR